MSLKCAVTEILNFQGLGARGRFPMPFVVWGELFSPDFL